MAGTNIASGIVANAKGMAPNANLLHYDWNSDASEMATAAEHHQLICYSQIILMGRPEGGIMEVLDCQTSRVGIGMVMLI